MSLNQIKKGLSDNNISFFPVLFLMCFFHAVIISINFLDEMTKSNGRDDGAISKLFLKYASTTSDAKSEKPFLKEAKQAITTKKRVRKSKATPVPTPEDDINRIIGEFINSGYYSEESTTLESEKAADTIEGNKEDGTTINKVSTAQIKYAYLQALTSEIEENKEYPSAAKRLGQSGTVSVYFAILKDGSFREVKLRKKSESSILNAAALDVLAKIDPFKAIPEELAIEHLEINMNIEYFLTYGGYDEFN